MAIIIDWTISSLSCLHSSQLMSEVDYHDILGPTCPRDSLNPRRDALARKSLAEEHYYRISDPPAEPSFRCFVSFIPQIIIVSIVNFMQI